MFEVHHRQGSDPAVTVTEHATYNVARQHYQQLADTMKEAAGRYWVRPSGDNGNGVVRLARSYRTQ